MKQIKVSQQKPLENLQLDPEAARRGAEWALKYQGLFLFAIMDSFTTNILGDDPKISKPRIC